MSSLRDLLDVPSLDNLPVQTYLGPGAHQYLFRGNHCWEYGSSYNYDWNRYRWCVPNECICRIKWEIWGGGGGGSTGAFFLGLLAAAFLTRRTAKS